MKDYYQILGIEPSATLPEIKKAYRQLAHQYHPDKNASDPYATAQFAEIKQAYEVLTNPMKKQYYLEQRWYEQSMGRKKAQPIIRPESVLKQAIEFDRHVSRLDVHRMNKLGLYHYVSTEFLSGDVIEKLNTFNELQTNKQIVLFILKNLYVFPPDQLERLQQVLSSVNTDNDFKIQINASFFKAQNDYRREKNRIWILLLLVIVLVLVIYFSGK